MDDKQKPSQAVKSEHDETKVQRHIAGTINESKEQRYIAGFLLCLFIVVLAYAIFGRSEPVPINTLDYHISIDELAFEHDDTFIISNSKVYFDTAEGLTVYLAQHVSYHKSESPNTTITVSQYDESYIDDKLDIYVGTHDVAELQTMYVRTFGNNIDWVK